MRRGLTVLVGIEEGGGGHCGREEKEARVDGDAGGDEGEDFESVELASGVGLLLLSYDDEE